MKTRLTNFDAAEYLKTQEEMDAYLEACSEEGDAAHMAHALGVVARAMNMSDVARKAGISRKGLYKALSENGNASFETITKAAKAIGYNVKFERAA